MSKPLHGFVKLNDLVSLYRSPNHSTKTEPGLTLPLIVFCSWVGAVPKHIAKYTDGYQKRFPNASILLLQSKVSSMFNPPDVSPAYKILDSFLESRAPAADPDKALLMIHAFSNGGANNVVYLAKHLRSKQQDSALKKIILDCCPGQPEILAIARAITLSLPNKYLVRTFGFYLIYIAFAIFMLIGGTLRKEDTITWIRRSLNDTSVFSASTPRLYLYSKADVMVRTKDVHAHAQDAREKGFSSVREEVFESAPHCALLTEDSARYWELVSTGVTDKV